MGKREEKGYQSPIVLPERKMNIFYFLEMKENLMGRGEEEERGKVHSLFELEKRENNLSAGIEVSPMSEKSKFFTTKTYNTLLILILNIAILE